jgi:NitT/TauT family transport system permease protein
VIWQESIAVFDIKRFLAPQPTAIASTFWDHRSELLHAGWYTFQEALGGFAIGCSLGILAALVLARWRGVGRALMPYAIAASAVPIIAFAPITNAWFGPFGKTSKMAIAAVLCFFPVFVNTLRGLTSVRPASIELMRSYAAGEVDIFRRVRIPDCAAAALHRLKIATVLSMIGAIVGEYFGGSPERARVLINSRNATFDFEDAWPVSVSPEPTESPFIWPSRRCERSLCGAPSTETDDRAESLATGRRQGGRMRSQGVWSAPGCAAGR